MGVDLNGLETMEAMMADHGWTTSSGLIRAAIAEIRELRDRPAVPPWTREKPTVPGWYWQRHAGWTADHHRGIVRIWRTWDGDFSGPSRLHAHGNIGIPDGFEWSGPLPEPPGVGP